MSLREKRRHVKIIPPAEINDLGIDHVPQGKKNNWCWVACAAMVLHYREVIFGRLCDLASTELHVNPADCCDDLPGGLCDKPASDLKITEVYRHAGIPARRVGGQVFDTRIVEEIKLPNRAPVELGYSGGFGRGQSGHVVLVVGYQVDDTGRRSFLISDPLNNAQHAGDIDGRWNETWLGLLPQAR